MTLVAASTEMSYEATVDDKLPEELEQGMLGWGMLCCRVNVTRNGNWRCADQIMSLSQRAKRSQARRYQMQTV